MSEIRSGFIVWKPEVESVSFMKDYSEVEEYINMLQGSHVVVLRVLHDPHTRKLHTTTILNEDVFHWDGY